MIRSRRIALVLVPLFLAGLVGLGCWVRPVQLRTSLTDLVSAPSRTSSLVARASADRVLVKLAASNESALAAAEARLQTVLQPDLASPLPAAFASLDDCHRLLSPTGRAAIARAAIRRYVASPLPPLFTPDEDPFALREGAVRACARLAQGPQLAPHERLVPLRLRPEVAADVDRLARLVVSLDSLRNELSAAGVRLVASGVPLHTARSATRCRRELSALTLFSLVFIALLARFVFQGLARLPLLALSLVVAVSAGGAALVWLFPSLHVLTLVFGTTVLGLVIDYSFHWLLQPPASRTATIRNLLVSCLTTEISLVPLALSSVEILRQSALLLGVGLLAALLYVLFCYPREVAA